MLIEGKLELKSRILEGLATLIHRNCMICNMKFHIILVIQCCQPLDYMMEGLATLF